MKISISTKFIVIVGVVTLVIGVAGTYLSVAEQSRFAKQIYFEKALSLVHSIDAGITEKEINDSEALKTLLFKYLLLNNDLVDIAVYMENQGVLSEFVSTSADSTFKMDDLSQNDLNMSFTSGNAVSNTINLNGQNFLYIFSPIHLSGRTLGVYKIVISLSELDASVKSQTIKLIIFSGIAIFFSSLGVFLLMRLMVTNPLTKLITLTKRIEKGDFEAESGIKSGDEFGELSVSFKNMAQQLKGLYLGLENRIKSRTRELEERAAINNDQKINLEQSSKAMLNLLEDAKDLERELKIEKSGVEAKVVERTRELSDEKARLLASIESFGRAYILLDAAGNILLTNHDVTKFLGEPDGEWTLAKIQSKFGEVLDISQIYKDCLGLRKAVEYKEVVLGSKYLKIRIAPIFTTKDLSSIIGVLILITDVTEEKSLQRTRDEFFSIASHELRTPLTAIRGNTSLIKQFYSKSLADPDLKGMIDDIEESSMRLINIVNDFLNMGRLEQGKIQFKPETFGLSEIVNEALSQYKETSTMRHLELKFIQPNSDIPKVYADKEKVMEVLVNLIGNSLKFTEKGEISISLKVNENFVYVSVSDTGRGIPLANQNLLFRKFQQAGSSIYTRDTTKGTGLGLYISKLMVEGMGGKIWLESSQEGKGSVFSFTLPISNGKT